MPDNAAAGLVPALVESAAAEWVMILSLVFGGCCSNVWALEAVLKDNPNSGAFLTFSQFAFVAALTVGSQVYLPPGEGWRLPRWRKNEVPIRRWMVQVVLFLSVSLMNNFAFDMKIPMAVHIIFRSGGLCVSMLTGYFMARRRYSIGQVAAGIIITAGIVLATLSAPRRPRGGVPAPVAPRITTTTAAANLAASSASGTVDTAQYAAGIALLAGALFLSAWLGIWQEQTYRLYGKKWREALFYCHFLSLPFFLPLAPSLSATLSSYASSPPMALFALPVPDPAVDMLTVRAGLADHLVNWKTVAVPSALVALAVNVVTQGMCIRGVNRLTSRVSSTTVNLVLTLRKAVSLAISVWFYGSGVSTGLLLGGAMVLGGTMVYSLAPAPVIVVADSVDKKADQAQDAVAADEVGAEEIVRSSVSLGQAGELRRRRGPHEG
ncbi:golgi uridine diphosphate-N-acetylglucosamine transporter [Cryptotrichosporon argae]